MNDSSGRRAACEICGRGPQQHMSTFQNHQNICHQHAASQLRTSALLPASSQSSDKEHAQPITYPQHIASTVATACCNHRYFSHLPRPPTCDNIESGEQPLTEQTLLTSELS
jgi:hypothetical protein